MKIKLYLSFVKFSHTLFAMPFAVVGFCMAIGLFGYQFEILKLTYVILCMVFARNSAMAFNRWTDRKWDEANTRTANREIPAGTIKPANAVLFVVINSIAFVATTFFINKICFYLSPVALGIVLGYSYTKRFTFLSHFILGIGLGLAPIGAFLAVSGEFKMLPILLSFAVWAWVSGFDILYSIQDLEFDRANNLFSVPAAFGIKSAILISRSMHLISALLIVSTAAFIPKSYLYISAVSLFCSLLIYQHSLVGSNKLDRINFAFFNLNGFASLLFSVLAVLAFCL